MQLDILNDDDEDGTNQWEKFKDYSTFSMITMSYSSAVQ